MDPTPLIVQTPGSDGPCLHKRKLSSLDADSQHIARKRRRRHEPRSVSCAPQHIDALERIAQMQWDVLPHDAHFSTGLELDAFVLDGSPVHLSEAPEDIVVDDVYTRLGAHCGNNCSLQLSRSDDPTTSSWISTQVQFLRSSFGYTDEPDEPQSYAVDSSSPAAHAVPVSIPTAGLFTALPLAESFSPQTEDPSSSTDTEPLVLGCQSYVNVDIAEWFTHLFSVGRAAFATTC